MASLPSAASHQGRGKTGAPDLRFREHPRGTGEVKGKHSELEMFLAHGETQIAPVGLQVGDVKISVLQIQRYQPVFRIEDRQDPG